METKAPPGIRQATSTIFPSRWSSSIQDPLGSEHFEKVDIVNNVTSGAKPDEPKEWFYRDHF
jgi:hypothetical protein